MATTAPAPQCLNHKTQRSNYFRRTMWIPRVSFCWAKWTRNAYEFTHGRVTSSCDFFIRRTTKHAVTKNLTVVALSRRRTWNGKRRVVEEANRQPQHRPCATRPSHGDAADPPPPRTACASSAARQEGRGWSSIQRAGVVSHSCPESAPSRPHSPRPHAPGTACAHAHGGPTVAVHPGQICPCE
jgi:hypothetical protein